MPDRAAVFGVFSSIAITCNTHLLVTLFLGFNVGDATKCYKNDVIGDRVGNVYYCNHDDQPECCELEKEYTCCETQTQKTVKEQLILWGSFAAVVMVFAILVLYFWKDINCCHDDRTLLQKYCRCCTKKDKDEIPNATSMPETDTAHVIPPSTSSYMFERDPVYVTPRPSTSCHQSWALPSCDHNNVPPSCSYDSPTTPPPFTYKH